MITLGIETSCDETSCGIVDHNLRVLANEIYSQTEQHARFGGVVPEIASRAHLEKIAPVVDSALRQAGIGVSEVDQFAFTRGPGLIGPLLVGASFAQGLARCLQKPVYGINHLEGHLAASYLSDNSLKAPFVCLTVSGGHTELYEVGENFLYRPLGKTRDDASGEAFDKCGKILGLGYPAGPLISKHALGGNPAQFDFPRGMNTKDSLDFSFSGLKTAFSNFVQSHSPEFLEENLSHICASLQEAIVEVLVKKSMRALEITSLSTLIVCGGVSANGRLRESLIRAGEKKGFRVIVPQFSLCTDNGAMIAGIAQIRRNAGSLPVVHQVVPHLPLEKSFLT